MHANAPAPTPPPEGSGAALAAELGRELARLAGEGNAQPFVNPVLLLAHHIGRRVATGEVDAAGLTTLIQHLTVEGFAGRAKRIGTWLGERNPEANRSSLNALVRGIAGGAGGTVPFEEFQRRVGRIWFGAVITAHPTFSLPRELMVALSDLAAGRDRRGAPLRDEARAERMQIARGIVHRPDVLTLEREHALSLEVVANMWGAIRGVYDEVFRVAEEAYPGRWTELRPRLISVASWVGYDLDGRSDVGWMDTMLARMRSQQWRLEITAAEAAAIRDAAHADGAVAAVDALDALLARIATALAETRNEIAAFAEAAADAATTWTRIQEVSRRMTAGLPERLTDSSGLVALLDPAIAAARGTLRRRLSVLRAELDSAGLGMAKVHVRVNATQLHNAIRSRVGLESNPGDPRYRTLHLERLDALLDEVKAETINFGSLMTERASARRLMMTVAQIRKYVDSGNPVRFLIAECETAFTPLAALYFARMFGVDDHVDISPLFETPRALEAGTRIVDTLLSNRHYRAYVRKRGRFCVQTGYSDAGRYLGQIPAAASIERFRLRLAATLEKHQLDGVELVIFDTHGESVGRGGHPGSLRDALEYVDTGASRAAFAAAGVDITSEVSFQGGDGYLYFLNPSAALAAVTRMLEHALTPPDPAPDPYYAERDTVREMFTVISEFQGELTADADYGALLGTFGPHLSHPSGSRAMVRQTAGADPRPITYASELRAIPQNAALQQLGVLANSWGGMGRAIERDPDRFADLYRASPRLRRLLGIAEYAVSASNFDAARAYVETLNPGMWLLLAEGCDDEADAERLRRIAATLEHDNVSERQDRVVRHLYADFLELREGLAALGPRQSARLDSEAAKRLALLHAVRVALIHEIFRLASRVPDFAPQQGTTHARTMLRLLHLDVPDAIETLYAIFRGQPAASLDFDFGEPASYIGSARRTYVAENERIFRPLEDLYELCRRVGGALAHTVGFFG